MKNMPKLRSTVVAVELDGVVFSPAEKLSSFSIGTLNQNVADVLRRLHKDGFSIVAWTCRTNQQLFGADGGELRRRVMDLLAANGLGFVSVHLGDKPCAGCYVDPRGVNFSFDGNSECLEADIRGLLSIESDIPTTEQVNAAQADACKAIEAKANEPTADEIAAAKKAAAEQAEAELKKHTPASAADRLPITNNVSTEKQNGTDSDAGAGGGGRPGFAIGNTEFSQS